MNLTNKICCHVSVYGRSILLQRRGLLEADADERLTFPVVIACG